MLVSKLKAIAATLLVVGVITSGVGLYAYQGKDPLRRAGRPCNTVGKSRRPKAQSRRARRLCCKGRTASAACPRGASTR